MNRVSRRSKMRMRALTVFASNEDWDDVNGIDDADFGLADGQFGELSDRWTDSCFNADADELGLGIFRVDRRMTQTSCSRDSTGSVDDSDWGLSNDQLRTLQDRYASGMSAEDLFQAMDADGALADDSRSSVAFGMQVMHVDGDS